MEPVKINIAARPEFLRDGYRHFDTDYPFDQTCILRGEADELIIPAIEYFHPDELKLRLDFFVSRVVPGGTFGIGAPDLTDIATRLSTGLITPAKAVEALYGDGKHFACTLEQLCVELESRGLKVNRRTRENLRCWASGTRL